MTALELAVAWVNAGGGEGAEREALVRSLHGPSLAAGVPWVCPSGVGVRTKARCLVLWKSAARRAIARGAVEAVNGRPLVERVECRVLLTPRDAARLKPDEDVLVRARAVRS